MSKKKQHAMTEEVEISYGVCCGIDVHKDILVACLMRKGKPKIIQEFGTKTKDLLEMSRWLKDNQCEMVAMESTGPYWKPVYNVLEAEGIAVIVVNAAHMKQLPGRKTDQKDAEWIAYLLRQDLLKASFIPDRHHRDLRDALALRDKLVGTRAAVVTRIQKTFEAANIKLGSVISDVTNMSGLNLLEELLERGEPTEERINEMKEEGLVAKQLKSSSKELAEALEGKLSGAQKKMLRIMLDDIKHLETEIAEMDALIDEMLNEKEHAGVKLLQTIPGVGEVAAKTLIGIISTDMSRFPSADHLCAWIGVAPGNNESAGKKKRCKTRNGNKIGKKTVAVCANSAIKKKDSYFAAKYKRLVVRIGHKKAIIAIAHSMMKAIWHMLSTGEIYNDLGADYFIMKGEKAKRTRIKHLESELVRLKASLEPSDSECA